MKLPQLVQGLESYLQEELGVQGRLIALLNDQEKAVISGETAEIERTASALESELLCEPQRDRRRRDLIDNFSRAFGVPSSMLTVRSLIERIEGYGSPCERVERLRVDLREARKAPKRSVCRGCRSCA